MRWKRKFKVGDKVYWDSIFDHERIYEEVHHETFKEGLHKVFFVTKDASLAENEFMYADSVELCEGWMEKPKRKIKVRVDTCVDFKPMEVEFSAVTYGYGVKWKKTRSKK